MREKLVAEFDDAMENIYLRALQECGYNATRFLQMLDNHRGLGTARILLSGTSKATEGYKKLWELQRLDLSVEALVLKQKWQPLFSAQELKIARDRLAQYEYKFEESEN